MFEEFYEMYEPEEQEVIALINRCIGGGFNWKGNFWEMTVVTLGIVFCDTGKVSTKEERLDWPVTEEERHSDKGLSLIHILLNQKCGQMLQLMLILFHRHTSFLDRSLQWSSMFQAFTTLLQTHRKPQ